MNKPKKTKPSPLESVSEVATDATEDEEPARAPSPEREPSSPPPPEPALPMPAAVEPETRSRFTLTIAKRWKLAKANLVIARYDLQKMEKKWSKVKKTYVDSGNYSRYDHKSVVERIEMRLFKADGDLANARLTHLRCRINWTRLRTYTKFRALWLQTQGEDPVINQFYQRAVTRLNEPLPEPSWETMWPGYGHNIWEWNQRHYGLAVTWGLIHDNSLRVAADDAADDAEADAAVAISPPPVRQWKQCSKRRSSNWSCGSAPAVRLQHTLLQTHER